jgi:FMN phosphatase YigB (HAD superfamily)
MLKTHGLDIFFEMVILSAVAGCRKPGGAIFEAATRAMGVEPKVSAYVGDRPSRDVAGPQAAGWGMTVILENARACQELLADSTAQPDALVGCLSELPGLFLPRRAFSTMDQNPLF